MFLPDLAAQFWRVVWPYALGHVHDSSVFCLIWQFHFGALFSFRFHDFIINRVSGELAALLGRLPGCDVYNFTIYLLYFALSACSFVYIFQMFYNLGFGVKHIL